MVTRRAFLQIGLTSAALRSGAAVDLVRAHTSRPLYKAVFDERFYEGVAFAEACTRRGIPIHGIRGDVTALWYHDLYFQWKRAPVSIAGVTTSESLFCLELLARDARLRVTDRLPLGNGLVSWSIGPRADQRSVTTFLEKDI